MFKVLSSSSGFFGELANLSPLLGVFANFLLRLVTFAYFMGDLMALTFSSSWALLKSIVLSESRGVLELTDFDRDLAALESRGVAERDLLAFDSLGFSSVSIETMISSLSISFFWTLILPIDKSRAFRVRDRPNSPIECLILDKDLIKRPYRF